MALVWTTHLKGGPKKVNHAAALVGKNIYSFGGYCSQDNMRVGLIDIYVLCTVTNRWKALETTTDHKELASVPFQRYGHTTVAYGTKIYLWGGKNEALASTKLHCFDTITQKWSCPEVKGSPPSARDGHTACIVDDKMYVFGGFADEFNQYADGLFVLDLTTMIWSTVHTEGEQPSCRDFHSAVAVNGKMYLFGGRGGTNEPFYTKIETYDNSMYIYDPKTKYWEKKSSPLAPVGRRSLGMEFTQRRLGMGELAKDFTLQENCTGETAPWKPGYDDDVVSGKRIYVFGGYNGITEKYYNDLHYYDTELDEWSGEIKTYGLIPCERRRHCTVLANNKIFVFGGTSSIARYYSELEDLYLGMNYFDDKCWINFDDLHVLDLSPTLSTLSMLAVIRNNLSTRHLPRTLQREIKFMTTNNKIKRSPFAMNA